jgi:hypothetical protein
MKLEKKPELKPWTARIDAIHLAALRDLSEKSDCGMNELLNLALAEFLKTVELPDGERRKKK